jgi:predicted nucleic acid-binding protein
VIVVDASAVLELVLATPAAGRIADRIFAHYETLHAPHLIDLEVAQVIRRYSRSGDITSARAKEALTDFADFPITRYPHDIFLTRIWELRDNLTAYDAAYVTLAEALSAPLLTCDAAIASATGHAARVELVR